MGWHESGRRKAKALPSKELAEHFKHIKYTQLNSDVFTGIVSADWHQILDEYMESKKVPGPNAERSAVRFPALHRLRWLPYQLSSMLLLLFLFWNDQLFLLS